MKSLLLCLALPVFVQTAGASDVVLGTTKITIPPPTGFVEISGVSPKYDALQTAALGDQLRFLAAFASDADLVQVKAGNYKHFRKVFIVAVPRMLEAATLSNQDFSALANRSIDAMLRAANVPFDMKSRTPSVLFGTDTTTLGMFVNNETSVGMVSLVPNAGAAPDLMANMFVNVKGKPLNIAVLLSGYEYREDVDWVKTTSREWLAEVRRANGEAQSPPAKPQPVRAYLTSNAPTTPDKPTLAAPCPVEWDDNDLAKGSEIVVTLSLLVGIDGTVKDTVIARSSGVRAFDRAVYTRYQQCKFKPAMENGHAVEKRVSIQYVWRIE